MADLTKIEISHLESEKNTATILHTQERTITEHEKTIRSHRKVNVIIVPELFITGYGSLFHSPHLPPN